MPSSTDRAKEGLDAYLDRRLAPLDYLALYPARILVQNADGTLEVRPDDARMPGMSSVPIRLGLPGVSVTVKPDSRVLIGFENGSPTAPVATIWDAATLDTITITATGQVNVTSPRVLLGSNPDDQRPVARVGDPVDILFPPLLPVAGTLSGVPIVGGLITITSPGLGMISAGSDEVTTS